MPEMLDRLFDPDLAPYMSEDEIMSEGEQMSIFATIAPKGAEMPIAPMLALGEKICRH